MNLSMMNFSVIVCTYNRASSLRKTISCLSSLTVSSDLEWEVVIVDNNSSDETRNVVDEFRATFPVPLRYKFEGVQGLSHARNRGVKTARGEVLLFTDDDVCPEPTWATELLDGMNEYRSDACGGYVAPIWETQKPDWLTERFYGYLALRIDEDGPKAFTRENNDTPYGANMAIKKHVFERFGLFDTARGRKGSTLASGEDGEFFQRLIEANERVYYFPKASVHHRIEAFRVQKGYFRQWRYQNSRNIAEVQGIPGTRKFLGIPLYVFRQTLGAVHRALIGRLTLPRDEAFYRELIVYHFLGLISGLYRSYKNHNP